MNLLNTIVGEDAKVTVNVELDNASITRLCVGLLIVISISLFLWGIIKKTV